MYIEKHFSIENPHDLAEALKGTYSDTDHFSVLRTNETPDKAEQLFLYALMQREGECILRANIHYAPSSETIEIYPGIFTTLQPVGGPTPADILPMVDYSVKAVKAGGSEIIFISNISPKIIKNLLPETKAVVQTVRKRYGSAHEHRNRWLSAASDIIPEL